MTSLTTTYHTPSAWILFAALIILLLALDLGVFTKGHKEISQKKAIWLSVFWIGLGIGFGSLVYVLKGAHGAAEYYTAFIIEKSLSVDNIFVFIMIFRAFQTPTKFQHRVLFYGIIGAIIMRAAIILAGTILLSRYDWITWIFGGILIYTAWNMFFSDAESDHEERESKTIQFLKNRFKRVVTTHDGKFIVYQNNKILFTTLFVTLVCIEISDLIFAIDSLPAVLAVSSDPFIILTSNIFAILGLRSLYFISSILIQKFSHLGKGVALVLLFVGLKMLCQPFFHVTGGMSLLVIACLLGATLLYSIVKSKKISAG